RVSAADRAAVRIQALVIGIDADAVAPGEHLDGEGLVELEEADVVERQTGLLENARGRGHGPEAHQVRLDAGERIADEAHGGPEAELVRGLPRGEQAGR